MSLLSRKAAHLSDHWKPEAARASMIAFLPHQNWPDNSLLAEIPIGCGAFVESPKKFDRARLGFFSNRMALKRIASRKKYQGQSD